MSEVKSDGVYNLGAQSHVAVSSEAPEYAADVDALDTFRLLGAICFLRLEKCFFLGNMDALRDWGHAKDYVRMQWIMLQQNKPEDFVIATGKQISVREFVRMSAAEAGITLEFTGEGVNEIATVTEITGEDAPGVTVGDVIVKVDPRRFRPAEVETLLGDLSKAKEKLGWISEITVEEMCTEMIRKDLDKAKQHALLKEHGYNLSVARE